MYNQRQSSIKVLDTNITKNFEIKNKITSVTIGYFGHNFLLLVFEVQILTKIRQNHKYLQIIS